VDSAVDKAKGPLRLLAGLALLVAVVMLGIAFGYVRAGLALVFAGFVLWLGTSYFTAAGEVPPEPEAEDVSASALKYVCPVCGLELRVEVATTDRAPRHCREAMVLVREGSEPPLRPI
jgi:hypothetical protein